MNTTSDGVGGADVLAALRRATATRHARLDSALPLSRAAATLADYAAHLVLLRNWLRPLHAALGQSGVGLPGLNRLDEIDADLSHPCLAGMFADGEGASRCWPDDMSEAYRWGICYVIEGSQLGGAVLYQRLREQLSPHPLAYLRGAGDGPGPRWRAFMLALRTHVRGEAGIADACAGACDAFDAILALAFPS